MDEIKRAKLELKKTEAKLAGLKGKIMDLEKQQSDSDKRQTELYQEWRAQLAEVTETLDMASRLYTGHLEADKRFLSGEQLKQIAALKQKLKTFQEQNVLDYENQKKAYNDFVQRKVGPYKDDKDAETKHARLRIQAPFWEELYQASPAGEVERTIKLYIEKFREAENLIAESEEHCERLMDKISAIAQRVAENETLAGRLGPDLDKVKGLESNLKTGNLRPRDLRQIEYEINKIQGRCGL
jgi:hypothetical protein